LDEPQLSCCSLLRSASQASPTAARMAGAVVFTEAAAFMAACFTAELADFMAADGTVASRASTMVSATATAATGTTVGEAGDTAGGGVIWLDYYPDYGYYSYGQPSAAQNCYYCSDPAGYYPYLTQCNTGWQTVPAS